MIIPFLVLDGNKGRSRCISWVKFWVCGMVHFHFLLGGWFGCVVVHETVAVSRVLMFSLLLLVLTKGIVF